ncbi:hypothetical protein ABIE45_006340 [Methylobacterium sp. OAE515]|uniref:hypothetical protein n=1 Tax=Methylobacterium sp. OAE515 TaxID=2817895 RepID=UPI0019FD50B1
MSALGFEPIEKKYSPKSIQLSEIFRRLGAMLPDFHPSAKASALSIPPAATPNCIQASWALTA